MNILFRCDGSIEIGMGHVVRCLALADHLKERHNSAIYFAIRKSELGINTLRKSYFVIQPDKNEFNYKEWLIDCINKTESKILIMDVRDGLSRNQLKQIKIATGVRVITIDDPEDKRLESDLAFYPPIPQIKNLNWGGFSGDLYVGWEYVILRKEFTKNKYLKPDNLIPNILVSMGGTDENNMTDIVIEAINMINEQLKLIIIVGSGFPHMHQLTKSLAKVQFEFELHQNPDNIAKIMSRTDFAIISFGQTAYELAALNIPALYICLTIDHEESSKLFYNEGIGVSLGVFSEDRKQKLVDSLKFHIVEKQKSIKMFNQKKIKISDLNRLATLVTTSKVND